MIDDWPAPGGRVGSDGADSATAGLLIALARLGDTQRIAQFLTQLVGTGIGYAKGDNPAIMAALALFPADEAATMVGTIVTGNAKRFAACADLLARCPVAPTLPRSLAVGASIAAT
jgi:hypothetical protein